MHILSHPSIRPGGDRVSKDEVPPCNATITKSSEGISLAAAAERDWFVYLSADEVLECMMKLDPAALEEAAVEYTENIRTTNGIANSLRAIIAGAIVGSEKRYRPT